MKQLLATLFSFACCFAVAQNYPLKTFSLEALTIDDGLSQGMVTCITQDRAGFMWIATKDGLNRYDGYHFVVYRHDVKDKNSLSDNFVIHIFEDSHNRLWVATADAMLNLFDRATGTFTHFSFNEKSKQGNGSNNILDLKEDLDGNLYVATDNGLKIMSTVKDKNGKESFLFTLIDDRVFCKIFAIAKDQIWVSPFNDSVYARTINNGKITHTNISFINAYFKDKPVISRQVNSFVYDSINHYVYVLLSNNLLRYDEKNNSWQELPGYLNASTMYGYCSLLDKSGLIWIIENERIILYDTKLRTAYRLSSNDGHQAQMLDHASYLYKDRSGNIWIGTKGYGLLKYNARAEKFHHVDNESINGLAVNNDQSVLVIKQKRFAYSFDKSLEKYTGFIPDTSNKNLLNGSILYAAKQDATGNYWLLYDYYPLTVYNENAKSFINPSKKTFYFPVYEGIDKKIWIGLNDSLFCYNTDHKKIAAYKLPVTNTNNYYTLIQTVYQQNDSIVWIGSTAGLIKFNVTANTWNQFKNDPSKDNSLSSDIIFSLCADPLHPEKYLWIGTNGGGLNRFDITTENFEHYTMKNGLPNDVIYGILSDDDNLWMSTNKGLSMFNIIKKAFQNYEAKDGLQSNEFNRYAYCKTKDGTLYFGGVNGFNYFNPKELRINNLPPNIVITDFKIGNRSITIYDDKKLLSQPIEMTKKIKVNYSDNMLSFDFAAMDFTRPSKNLYQYKMEGFDKSWIQSGIVHSATYTNLDPGTYTFHVKGSNSDGVWNENGASIQLIILPPWYMTWWFRTLMAALITAVIYGFYRYRLQQALKMQAIRNKIASDLHDEIGSSLSSISIFSDVAREQSEGQPVSSLINKISNYTQESMEAMSDIVWMINAHNDRFENIIIRMRELAAELSEAKKYTLHFEIDEQLNNIKLGMNERRNLWLIYKEALNNSAKYADAKNVWIQMQAHQKNISLIIKDDGRGFDTNIITTGNGLSNMQTRAEAMNGKLSTTSSIGNGTCIELKFKV